MSKPFVFEKPLGMRDILPEVVERKSRILHHIQMVLKMWGYHHIETPTLEFYDTVGGVSSTMEQRLFKLLDQTGRSLVLRPDMTAPIARVVGSLLKEEPFPIRLSYSGNVFRAQENEAGRNAEFPEVGIELVGEAAPDADAEVISLAIASLQAVKVNQFKLAIGHIGFMNGLFTEMINNKEKEDELKRFLHQNNYVGYRQYVEREGFTEGQRDCLLTLLELRGGKHQLEVAKGMACGERSLKAVQELEDLWEVLGQHGVTEHLIIDLTLVRDMDYYTGVLFEGYADQLGFPICHGGRYDNLLGQFGRPAPATGFALKVDRILEVSKLHEEDSSRTVLITYTEFERKEAFELAKKRRAEEQIVILHRVTGDQGSEAEIGNVGTMKRKIDEWIRLEKEGR
jgi:ATP phosphoribosyltransferase regulatory subunit